jgi:hypothetical protein
LNKISESETGTAAKEEGFKIHEIEFKGSKHKENEDKYYKHYNKNNRQ